MEENRFIGILVNSSLYKGIASGNTHHEALRFYEEAGKLYDLTPCYFRLQDMKPGQDSIVGYVMGNKGYRKATIPAPRIIHNRALYFTKSAKKRIDQLDKDGKHIFNKWNRYGKLQTHELLMQDVSLRPHLPGTLAASTESIKHMMNQYTCLIIKPNSSSIGRGVMKAERNGDGWHLIYNNGNKGAAWKKIKFTQSLPAVLKHKIQSKDYVVQQRLPLATYKERPFDLRVSVQRNVTGEWQVTGIAGKAAKKDAFITNVAQGGTVYTLASLLEEYPHLHAEKVYMDIESFSLRAARHLGMYLPHLADIGLDVGITAQGFPMFIECNGRDLRYSFQKGKMMREWRATYANPMGYARYLMDVNANE